MAAAAGITAAGSVLGGVLGGKGAKAAAKKQLQGVREQIAATERNRTYQYGLNAPTIDAGARALTGIEGLLNIGGDPAAATAARDQFRAGSGYQDLLDTGLAAVNSNAYARGMGNSGATQKALLRKATGIADQSQQGYIGNLLNVANLGGQARGLVAGVGTNSTNAINQATQNGADASSNAALLSSANWAQTLQNLANTGASYLGSSYGNEPTISGTTRPGYGGLPGIY